MGTRYVQLTRKATKSQPRNLLLMARLNSAKSRVRQAIFILVLID